MHNEQISFFMKKLFFLFSILVLGYYIVASCVHEADISDIKPVCFQQDILPLINANCTRSGCHDGAVVKSGLAFVPMGKYGNMLFHTIH